MKKNKIFKLFLVIFSLPILLLLIIFVSKLFLYKKEDFNISSDFFVTRFSQENFPDGNNGFNDYLNFVDSIDSKIGNFDLLSRCVLGEMSNGCDAALKNLSEDDYNSFKNYVFLNEIKFSKINENDFILQSFEKSEYINAISLKKYTRGIRYVSYIYFENGDKEMGLRVLFKYQDFLDNLFNKFEGDLFKTLLILELQQINLQSINYFTDNYELSDSLYSELKSVLEKDLYENFSLNSLKWVYLYSKNNNTDIIIDIGQYDSFLDKIKLFLFYSSDESKLLYKKIYYDYINLVGEELSNFNQSLDIHYDICKVDGNDIDYKINLLGLGNFVGRFLVCNPNFLYLEKQLIKSEIELRNLRNKLLDDINR